MAYKANKNENKNKRKNMTTKLSGKVALITGASAGLQFGHFEKVTPGKFQDFLLVEIFCWYRKSVRCNDFGKWSHYTFRAVS